MDAMTIPDVWSGQDRALTVEDMANMPDDEFRYELDDGVLIVSPAPSRLHQLAVTRLAVILSAACPAEFVVLAGVGVNISKFQHRVPDVAVVRADSFQSFFQEVPPELVVEVASPRTAGRSLDEEAITLAVVASVRHEDTEYDPLLMSGVSREDARERIRTAVDRILTAWAQPT